jgi:uncharacterized membrane protein
VFKFGGRPDFFHTLMFPSGNVFLYYTLRTICNSSLGVWKNTLFVCLFVYLFFCSRKKNEKNKRKWKKNIVLSC